MCQVTDDSGSSVEKSFVVAVLEPIDESFDCTSTSDSRDVEWLEACKPTLTASVYLNSTSPTGRTLDIKTSSDFYQSGVIFGCDLFPSCTSTDLIFSENNHGGRCDGGTDGIDSSYCFSSSNSWSVPLPENVEAGTYTIPWKYINWNANPDSIITPPPMSVTVPTLPGSSIIDSAPESSVSELIIRNIPGSGIPGCEPDCFVPSNGIINPGGTVVWKNDDSAPHTTTSGKGPANGPDGFFDSGLMMPGNSFAWTFEDEGIHDYFCMVHPWMIGKITVTGDYIESQSQDISNVMETESVTTDETPVITDEIIISPLANSATCDVTKSCLSPYHAQVMVNEPITWAATPFTTSIVSGNVTNGPDGKFEFGFKINEEFSVDFAQPGIYQYFDMINPWISGTITVTAENLLMHFYQTLQMQFLFPTAFAVSDFPIKTDSDSYIHGQVVKVSGITSEKNLSLQVKDPTGKTILIRTLPAEGNFSFDLNIPAKFILGQYEIFASVTVDGIPKIVSTSINLQDENDTSAPIYTSSINAPTESSEEQTSQSSEEQTSQSSEGGGCLIATAAFGSEMAPQVQFLREIRDETVMNTQSGASFMTGFNQFYYSFSPYVADYERENLVFKEVVKVTLSPLLTSLTLLNYVEIDSEEEMLGYGIGIILLNIGMYFVAPASLILVIKRRLRK
ncbi:hypothetical protein OAJ83_02295 [Candidatus Nitrosopelagicus sp.]|nr:hypothetical protein [Candidatus Nitrosopelagicus sp.]